MSFLAYLSPLPNFVLYFGLSLILLAMFVAIYLQITPHQEFALIRAGNVAASVSLGGALLGFVLPLAVCITHAVSLVDLMLWGLVTLVVQSAVFFLARWLKPDLSEHIGEGSMAHATFVASLSIAIGVLNAASLVP
jgi:putative membrane protein